MPRNSNKTINVTAIFEQSCKFFRTHPAACTDPFYLYKLRHGIDVRTPMNFDQWWRHSCSLEANRSPSPTKRYIPHLLFLFCRANEIRTWDRLMTISDHKVVLWLQTTNASSSEIQTVADWLRRRQTDHYAIPIPTKPGRHQAPTRR